ncbi:class I SAM-dependent methyltransferase [Gordonia sp. N1V]|uniref:class I SAM-dependent methyltransferase n=1 Tax=Gordonia sp. N1V TaxID=3034163 RepID=UPI0023E33E45|nr:class I SAM-dependent methyltransferase [Gordonia sp. N1V]MDF3282782.1 class I SAM-dependent methyltransferase [Gordonia sp. N1V]
MTTSQPSHLDRRRAESFGPVADAYDRYRPPFPPEVIERLLPVPGMSVLDVGAGTGMVSAPMAAAGASVLAVEPDPLMAEKARAKGIVVEEATFEEWDARGRTFDLVVFARSPTGSTHRSHSPASLRCSTPTAAWPCCGTARRPSSPQKHGSARSTGRCAARTRCRPPGRHHAPRTARTNC